MAKRGEGTPSIKRTGEGRRQLSRKEREDRLNRWVIIGTGTLVAAIVILLVAGIVFELAIKPNQAVAKVGDESITTSQFQQRVKFQRFQTLSNMLQFCTAEMQQYFGDQCQQWQSQLEFPTSMGSQVLEIMIEDVIIRQEADERGITVSEEELQEAINERFGYDPNAEPPTPTAEPTSTPTPRYTPTLTNTPAPTVTPTAAEETEGEATPAFTLAPTETPTAMPTLTGEEKLERFEEQYGYQTELVQRLTGLDEAAYREIIKTQTLRDKLYEEITSAVPAVAEQIHIRQMRFTTQEAAIEIMEALRDGESFAELARTADAAREGNEANWYRGGDLGWVPKDQLAPNVAQAAFEAEIGEVVGPILDTDLTALQQGAPTADYYYVIQVLGHEVRPVAENILSQQRQDHFDTWLNAKTTEAERYRDIWIDRVPEEPTEEDVISAYQEVYPTATAQTE